MGKKIVRRDVRRALWEVDVARAHCAPPFGAGGERHACGPSADVLSMENVLLVILGLVALVLLITLRRPLLRVWRELKAMATEYNDANTNDEDDGGSDKAD